MISMTVLLHVKMVRLIVARGQSLLIKPDHQPKGYSPSTVKVLPTPGGPLKVWCQSIGEDQAPEFVLQKCY